MFTVFLLLDMIGGFPVSRFPLNRLGFDPKVEGLSRSLASSVPLGAYDDPILIFFFSRLSFGGLLLFSRSIFCSILNSSLFS